LTTSKQKKKTNRQEREKYEIVTDRGGLAVEEIQQTGGDSEEEEEEEGSKADNRAKPRNQRAFSALFTSTRASGAAYLHGLPGCTESADLTQKEAPTK
jgi:hypothetical protein